MVVVVGICATFFVAAVAGVVVLLVVVVVVVVVLLLLPPLRLPRAAVLTGLSLLSLAALLLVSHSSSININ